MGTHKIRPRITAVLPQHARAVRGKVKFAGVVDGDAMSVRVLVEAGVNFVVNPLGPKFRGVAHWPQRRRGFKRPLGRRAVNTAQFRKFQRADEQQRKLFKEASDKNGAITRVPFYICPKCGGFILTAKNPGCPDCGVKPAEMIKAA